MMSNPPDSVESVALVGRDPGRHRGDPLFALFPWPRKSSGHRMLELTPLQPTVYIRRLVRTNLFPYDMTGRPWPKPEARSRASALLTGPLRDCTHVVTVGREVTEAFGATWATGPIKDTLCQWHGASVLVPTETGTLQEKLFVVGPIPHPSGLNRWYNDEANVERVRWFLRRTFWRVPDLWRQEEAEKIGLQSRTAAL